MLCACIDCTFYYAIVNHMYAGFGCIFQFETCVFLYSGQRSPGFLGKYNAFDHSNVFLLSKKVNFLCNVPQGVC